jgi:hypothetical protein
MASTPILPYAVWASGTNQNSIPANDNALRNQILNGNVISQSTTAQPGSPTAGDIYIIPASATGAQWATFTAKDLAIYSGGTWYAFAPVIGVVVNVAGTQYQYNGSAWAAFASGMTNPMTTVGDLILGGASGAPGRLAIGATAGQVLTSDGTTAAWAAPAMAQNSQSTAYTAVLADAGKHILHPAADTTARVFTIPANSSVAYPIGTALTIVNQNAAGVVTISITTDTMRLAGAGTTGSRTLAANGIATALKITSTEWIISGSGLT